MRSRKVLNDIGQALHDYCFREDILEEQAYLDEIKKVQPYANIGEISDQLLLLRFFIVDFGVKLAVGNSSEEEVEAILDAFYLNLDQTLNDRDFPRVQYAMDTYWSHFRRVGQDRFIDEVPYVFENLCNIRGEEVRLAGLANFSLFIEFVIKTSQLEGIYK